LFEVEIVSLLDAVQHTPDYLRKNPNHWEKLDGGA
jgi:hypothetical protein